MSDLFRDFLVWLMGFTGCSVLVFAAACFAKKQLEGRQKQVAGKESAETDASSPAVDSQLSPKIKWLVFALAPVLYLLLLGPALSELNTHFQKIQSERAMLIQTAESPQTIEPIPDSIGTRGPSRIGYQISKNQFHRTSPCSCRTRNSQETPTQSAKPDVPSDSDDSEWEVSPGWQLSTGDMHDVAEGDVAEIDQDDQAD
ncbi:MAG: hypothetical protein IH899_15620 [Planctomycetes bacterium]|nr:hypothetical protein [Planctomycetota bacterium]